MSWEDDREDTVEDQLNAILRQIETQLEQGYYGACQEIPKETELIGKPALQKWARRLRNKCLQAGISL